MRFFAAKGAFAPAAIALGGLVAVGLYLGSASAESMQVVPAPAMDESLAQSPGSASLIVAGGCFWGVQAVFQHTEGVTSAVSGYAGGDADTAVYEMVGRGNTGHAEAVKIDYDPSQITAGELLQIFFSVAHDPTQVNRQGPDVGPQYRSAIFTANGAQADIVKEYIAQLDAAGVYGRSDRDRSGGACGVLSGRGLPPGLCHAEPGQRLHRLSRYPKDRALERLFPDVYRDEPALVFANAGG